MNSKESSNSPPSNKGKGVDGTEREKGKKANSASAWNIDFGIWNWLKACNDSKHHFTHYM